MPDEALPIGPQALGEVERSRSFLETAESDKGPGPTELCVRKSGRYLEHGLVLTQNRPRIVTQEPQRRETDAIVGAARIGGQSRPVSALGAVEIPEPRPHQSERVPNACIA